MSVFFFVPFHHLIIEPDLLCLFLTASVLFFLFLPIVYYFPLPSNFLYAPAVYAF